MHDSDKTQRRIIRLYIAIYVEVDVNMVWHARVAKDYNIILTSSSGSYNFDLGLVWCINHLHGNPMRDLEKLCLAAKIHQISGCIVYCSLGG